MSTLQTKSAAAGADEPVCGWGAMPVLQAEGLVHQAATDLSKKAMVELWKIASG